MSARFAEKPKNNVVAKGDRKVELGVAITIIKPVNSEVGYVTSAIGP
jgi:hypothetical protein